MNRSLSMVITDLPCFGGCGKNGCAETRGHLIDELNEAKLCLAANQAKMLVMQQKIDELVKGTVTE